MDEEWTASPKVVKEQFGEATTGDAEDDGKAYKFQNFWPLTQRARVAASAEKGARWAASS